MKRRRRRNENKEGNKSRVSAESREGTERKKKTGLKLEIRGNLVF